MVPSAQLLMTLLHEAQDEQKEHALCPLSTRGGHLCTRLCVFVNRLGFRKKILVYELKQHLKRGFLTYITNIL